MRHLNALHPAEKHNGQQMVQLYEKGYGLLLSGVCWLQNFIIIFIIGKDAAGIAMEAINFARDSKIDVVLVDTAGRMQDNEPLMRALAKVVIIFGCKRQTEFYRPNRIILEIPIVAIKGDFYVMRASLFMEQR